MILMSREISLFADYTQKENRITNYCGVMLKMLYKEDPEAFQECINIMLQDTEIAVSPVFEQQKKMKESIPDLSIRQTSLEIFFETKIEDWFYKEQIEKHVDGFSSTKSSTKIIFLLCNQEIHNYMRRFYKTIEYAKSKDVIIKPITFEDFLHALKLDEYNVSDTYKDMLRDFEDYLERKENLLPRWKNRLDIINCARSMNQVLEGNAYFCPSSGGAYSHKRAKFFGAYADREVCYIAEIKGVVVKDKEQEYVKYNNTKQSDQELIEEANVAINKFPDEVEGSKTYGIQVFILDKLTKVNYKKETKGGVQWSKKYEEYEEIKNIEQLYNLINNKTWK